MSAERFFNVMRSHGLGPTTVDTGRFVRFPGQGKPQKKSRGLVREKNADDPTDAEVQLARELYLRRGLPLDNVPDEHIRQMMRQESDDFRDKALTSAEDAASIILEGVKEKRWRILVGEDAEFLDQSVRADPESAYELEFYERVANREVALNFGDGN